MIARSGPVFLSCIAHTGSTAPTMARSKQIVGAQRQSRRLIGSRRLCCERCARLIRPDFLYLPESVFVASPGIFLACDRSIRHRLGAMRGGETMIDALINVATFAVLVLCITGFGVHRHNAGRRDGRSA